MTLHNMPLFEMNPIEEVIIKVPITLAVEESEDFGKGIIEAFVRLAEKLEHNGERRESYGLISKNNQVMTYHAGFTLTSENEAKLKQIPVIEIPAGIYHAIRIDHWNQHLQYIGPAFDQLIKSGTVDISSPCIEYYKTETELVCMILSKE